MFAVFMVWKASKTAVLMMLKLNRALKEALIELLKVLLSLFKNKDNTISAILSLQTSFI